MRPITINLAALAIFAGFAAAEARAQTLVQQGYRPVEQIVEDIDLLSTSYRRVEPGLGAQGGADTRVYRHINRPGKLYYIAPGITAEYDRSSYSWFRIDKKEWKLFQLIPPNTVFHVGPPPAAEPPLDTRPPNMLREQSRIIGYAGPDVVQTSGWRRIEDPNDSHRQALWRRYGLLREAHRRAVLEAIGGGAGESGDPSADEGGTVKPASQRTETDTAQ